MRSLTPDTITAKNADNMQPYCLLKWELPAPVGTLWLSGEDLGDADGSDWENAMGRVLEWGTLRLDLAADKRVNVVSDLSISLQDDDKAIWDYLQSVEPQRSLVTVYQGFKDLAETDLVTLFAGIVNAPVEWTEDRHALRLDLTDIATYRDATVGHFATEEDFPYVNAEDQDSLLPIVVGRVRRSPLKAVTFGAVTSLARDCNSTETTLFVNDAKDFPQDTAITIVVEGEHITGSFHGNVFHVTARGAAVYNGTVTTQDTTISIIDSALTGSDDAWVGYYFKVSIPGGWVRGKTIRRYDATNKRLTYGAFPMDCFIDYTSGGCWTIPATTAYSIDSWARAHQAGVRVHLLLTNYVYILNDAPSKAVRQIEGFGKGSADSDYETYIPINPNWYTIDLNDTTTFPALGRAVTTATFDNLPTMLSPNLRDDSLWADMDGIETDWDSSGTLVENPADVIEMIHQRFMAMTPGTDTDSSSFADAATETAALAMSFTLLEPRNGMDLCADLAFQARCAEVWNAGIAYLLFLENKMPGPGIAAVGDLRYLASLNVTRRDFAEIVTEISARYLDRGEEKTVVVESSSAESAYGRHARGISLWAYATREFVQAVATFWLNRWRFLFERIDVSDSLRRLNIEPNDLVTIDLPDWYDPAIARVVGIEHVLGGGAGAAAPALKLYMEKSYFPDEECDTIAEGMGGEFTCWACETSCQALCELDCTTSAELDGVGSCSLWACETSCETGCETACETGCESGCETGCETSCETGCEGGSCQTGCQAFCEAWCEVACESSCQADCETACESACEAGCETGCEVSCETGCETGCEACETSCEGDCETGCELHCEVECQAGCEIACETGCESLCEMNCEFSGCETGCEAMCQTGCEVECEYGCQSACEALCEALCQVGCELCETGCETSCELGCEATACETGCEVACELACESGACEGACESGCELDCETAACEGACETSCEIDCETAACEGSCETGCELECENAACEGACETSCETGGCETAGCEGACETQCELECEGSGCEGACETGCQLGCEAAACEGACETGCQLGCEAAACEGACEASCQLACEATACEGACETGCESGCETSCETGGCETSCETGCEIACETGCEIACETGCETACQTGCEIVCETACETSCETGCETGDEIPAGSNGCNSCDPAISDTLYVTISGLTGTLSHFNAEWAVTHESDCDWFNSSNPSVPATPYVKLFWDGANSRWHVYCKYNLFNDANYHGESPGSSCAPWDDDFSAVDEGGACSVSWSAA